MCVLLISVFSTVYHVAVEPEDIKKLGSTLNTLCNEKVKAQKVSMSRVDIPLLNLLQYQLTSYQLFEIDKIINFYQRALECSVKCKHCFRVKRKRRKEVQSLLCRKTLMTWKITETMLTIMTTSSDVRHCT